MKHTTITFDVTHSPLAFTDYTHGRIFTQARTLGLSDTSFDGTMRFDTLARIAQDIAASDMSDAGLEAQGVWVVRRTHLQIKMAAYYRDHLEVSTFCAGFGRAWAQRRTIITRAKEVIAQVSSLWIQTDPITRSPKSLTPEFLEIFGPSTSDRTVSHRLEIKDATQFQLFPWQLRITDFDLLQHLNNAAYFEVGEELLANDDQIIIDRTKVFMVAEYREGINKGQNYEIRVAPLEGESRQVDFVADDSVQGGLYIGNL